MLCDSLLEREFELRALRDSLSDAANGTGNILVLDAPAGLGKTALIRLARHEARRRGFTVLSARGAQSETDFDFGAVRQLFEPVMPPPGAHPADRLLANGEAPHGSLSDLFNGLYRLLLGLAERGPAVVIVDDVQWVDARSACFLGFLARRVEAVGAALLVTVRSSRRQYPESLDEILGAAEARLLRPRELSREAVGRLVRLEFGEESAQEFGEACHRATGGKPLFVRELLRLLAARGVRPDAQSAALALAAGPEAVRRHVIAALRRPPGTALGVAGAVAALGDAAGLPRIAQHCGLTLAAAAAAADQLVCDGVFERADPPAIANDAVREVLLSLAPRALPAPLGERPIAPRARTSPDTLDSFTPAEREVTALVIKGLTNRQVARHLFLSEKTVEAHLSRAYRKAGVRSRTQLTACLSGAAAG